MLAPGSKILTCVVLLALAACSSKKADDQPEPKRQDAVSRPAPSPADASVAAGDGDTGEPTGDPFAAIGVEPCDKYIERQKSCVEDHAPAGIKDQQLDGLAHIATRWRRAAAAGAKDHLQSSCESLLAASADATAAWKCKW